MPRESAYLFLEITIFFGVILLFPRSPVWRELGRPTRLRQFAVLFFVWLGVDVIALNLGLWHFPQGSTLRFRFLNLPIEELILFVIHSMLVLIVGFAFLDQEVHGTDQRGRDD